MSEQQKMMAEFIERKKGDGLWLPLNLQYFANGDDDPDDDDPSDDPDDGDDPDDDPDDSDDDQTGFEYKKGAIDQVMTDNSLDFNQILKDNPKLKKAYTQRFNKNMKKRMEKFDDVDVEEYKDLKKRAEEGNLEGDAKTWKDKYDKAMEKLNGVSKKSTIQSVAISEGLDSEQSAFVSEMINLDNLSQDDEGEWTGVEDEIDRIKEKFPRMFPDGQDDDQDDDDDDDQDDDQGGRKRQRYNPGKKKHNGGGSKTKAKSRGQQRAMERHAKRLKKQ